VSLSPAGGGGHFAAERTLARLRGYFWWPMMKEDAKLFCQACSVCAMVRSHNHLGVQVFEQHTIQHAKAPAQIWHIDFIDMPESDGFRAVLVAVCDLSCWVELIPCKGQRQDHVLQALREIVGRHGWMQGIRCDNGSGLVAGSVKQWLLENGVKHWEVPARAPQANGKVEVTNRTAKHAIRARLAECARRGTSWIEAIPETRLALNSAVTSATENRFSAFEIMMGRKARMAMHNALSEAEPAQRDANVEEQRQGDADAGNDDILLNDDEEARPAPAQIEGDEAIEAALNLLERDGVLETSRQEVLAVRERQREATQARNEKIKAAQRDAEFEVGERVWMQNTQSKDESGDRAFVATGNLQQPGQARRVDAEVLAKIGKGTYRLKYWVRLTGAPRVTTAKARQLKRRVFFSPTSAL
jgi:hypothetical protein